VRPPKGFAPDAPHIDAIKNRHFFGMIEVNVAKRPPRDLAGTIAKGFGDLLPLMAWLRVATGAKKR